MITNYTIRHRTRGDVGRFASQTEAILIAFRLAWAAADWSIELLEARS